MMVTYVLIWHRNTTDKGPIYDRLNSEAEKMREENERRRLQLLEESTQECTFTPKLSKSYGRHNSDSAKKNDQGVFNRLAETPTAMHPVRREKPVEGSRSPPPGDALVTPVKRPVLVGRKNSTPATGTKTEPVNGASGAVAVNIQGNDTAVASVVRVPSDADLMEGLQSASLEVESTNGFTNTDQNGTVENDAHTADHDSAPQNEEAADEGDDVSSASSFVKSEKIVL